MLCCWGGGAMHLGCINAPKETFTMCRCDVLALLELVAGIALVAESRSLDVSGIVKHSRAG